MALAPEDVLAGYAFQIEIDGVTIAQFQEVSGLSSEITVIEQHSNLPGGKPILKKTPGARKHGDIQLKRGHTDSAELQKWIKDVLQGNISQARKNGSVVIYDYERGEVARYNFVNAWPSKWSLGTLKAGSNDILLEEVTITHEGLMPA